MTNTDFGEGMIVTFNQNVTGTVTQAKVTIDGQERATMTEPTVSGNTVEIATNLKLDGAEHIRTGKVEIVISGVTYEATFNIPSSSMS